MIRDAGNESNTHAIIKVFDNPKDTVTEICILDSFVDDKDAEPPLKLNLPYGSY